jgi:hypothetical protein
MCARCRVRGSTPIVMLTAAIAAHHTNRLSSPINHDDGVHTIGFTYTTHVLNRVAGASRAGG